MAPRGMNKVPMNMKVMTTNFGTRRGLHAGSSCCVKGLYFGSLTLSGVLSLSAILLIFPSSVVAFPPAFSGSVLHASCVMLTSFSGAPREFYVHLKLLQWQKRKQLTDNDSTRSRYLLLARLPLSTLSRPSSLCDAL